VADLLAIAGRGERHVGVELETGVLRAEDLQPATYEGTPGIGLLLERFVGEGLFAEPALEHGRIIGLRSPGGESITLEPGGQLELSSRPHLDLLDLDRAVGARVREMVRLAEAEGLLLVGGGLIPSPQEAMPWMPKDRYRIMRAYFETLGEPGRLAHTMMQRTLSVQVSFDYRDGLDAAELLRLSFLAAPVATAIFAASPLDGTEESGFLSFRAEAWRFTDPGRSGEVAPCARERATLRDYVEFALDVPLMFRAWDGQHLPMHGASFRGVLERGSWGDGTPVTLDDLWTQLGSVFTDARLKKGLVELRSTDGPLPGEVSAIPAFWVGLLYDGESRAAVADLLGRTSDEARARAIAEAPRLGLAASYGDRTLLEVARDLARLARQGLERRIDAGLERPEALDLLAPIERRLAAGRSPAHDLLDAWRGEWGRDRGRLIEALRL
jgi:glutamate--cysteine ligase